MMNMRSSTNITLSVWRALLLREALTRVSGGRAPWIWLILEPMVHMAFFVFIFKVIGHRVIGGIETETWVITGMLAFFMFRRTGQQGVHGISANRALFSYRQVRPVDTVIVRALMEGLLMLLISLCVLAGAGLIGYTVMPDDPLRVMASIFCLWMFGLGFGLVLSVPKELIKEFDFLISFSMMPLYLISGVVMPTTMLPQNFRDFVMLNPITHGIESVRQGYARFYHAPDGLDLGYLFGWASMLVFLGLAMQVRFSRRLIAQ